MLACDWLTDLHSIQPVNTGTSLTLAWAGTQLGTGRDESDLVLTCGALYTDIWGLVTIMGGPGDIVS